MKEFILYKIENKINGKVYFGKTIRSLEVRWKQHISRSNSYKNKKLNSSMLYNATNKHGIKNFEIIILSKCSNIEELNELEEFVINEYRLLYPDNIYNIARGGLGGCSWENHP